MEYVAADATRRLTLAAAWIGPIVLLAAIWVVGKQPEIARELPRGVRQPGLALQLATSREDFEKILGEPIVCPGDTQAPDRSGGEEPQLRPALDAQQVRDFYFIPLYVGFLALVACRGPARIIAILAILGSVAAGLFDFQEDLIIRDWLSLQPSCSMMPRPWSILKWSALFGVLLLNIPAVLPEPDVKGTARWFGYLAAAVSAFAGISGFFALLPSVGGARIEDVRLVAATVPLAGAWLMTWLAMAGFAWFPRGLLEGMERLASHRFWGALAEWPGEGADRKR